MSPGTGASMIRRARVTGCVRPTRQACSAWRGKARSVAASAASTTCGPPRLAVDRVADNRPAARGEVDADLMRAAGDQAAAQQRQAGGGRGHAREPLESASGSRRRRCADATTRRWSPRSFASRRSIRPRATFDAAVDDREVVLLGCPATPSRAAAPRASPRSWRRRRRPRSACRGGRRATAADPAGQSARVPQQRVQQRAGGVLVGRVHHDAGRLVDASRCSSS